MSVRNWFSSRLAAFRERRDREKDLGRELKAHLDLEAEEQQESGLSQKKHAMPLDEPSATPPWCRRTCTQSGIWVGWNDFSAT
jgi:hypothetical protein